MERHVGPACGSAGIRLDELGEIIGDHWMSTLWGCVFEDLVSAGAYRAQRRGRLFEAPRLERERRDSRLHRGSATLQHEPVRGQRYRRRRELPGRVIWCAAVIRCGCSSAPRPRKPVPVEPDCRAGRDGPRQRPRSPATCCPSRISSLKKCWPSIERGAEESARRGGEAWRRVRARAER